MDLLVYRAVPEPPAPPGVEVVSFEELKTLGSRGVLRRAWRYRRATLLVGAFDQVSRPLSIALSLRVLARGRISFEDAVGRSRRLGMARLWRMVSDHRRDRRAAAGFAAESAAAARALAAPREMPALDLEGTPLHVRTDLAFGVRSGGSVGHIAGVLTHLGSFGGQPVFLTADPVPTVPESVETHIVSGPDRYADIPELWAAAYTACFTRAAREALGDRAASFVYQRYGLNDYAGLALSRELDVPLVVEFNSSEVWKAEQWGRGMDYPDLARAVEESMVRGADLVLVVSEALRSVVVELGADPDRVLVNPNGVDPDRYAPSVDGGPVREALGLTGMRTVGFIGTFGPWHGADVLVEAFGRLVADQPGLRDDVRLLLVGDGKLMPTVRARIAEHGIEDVVVLTGVVPQESGPSYLAAMDVLASPHVPNPDGTPFFGSPTKIFEYMAMGRGIVASALGQVGDVLDDGETALLVPPGDVDALARAMGRLIDDRALCERLGAAARERALEEHTWKQHVGRIVEALEVRARPARMS